MKKITTAITLVLAGSVAIPAIAANQDSDSAVTVQFHEPDTYTDFKMKPIESQSDQKALEKQMRDRIQQIAKAEVPPQYHLDLNIRDIDLAGEFEPENGPDADNVRIVRAVYPPEIELDYTLKGPGGNTVSSGTRTLTNLAFEQTLKSRPNDDLFYEAELIRNFVSEITRPT